MSKKMLINATHPEENRVAIVENGVLTELGIEVAGREPTKGNIYKAAVVRVEPGLQAAFVDYGAERLGFLQIDEVNATLVKPGFKVEGRPKITDLLQRGQELLVQIVKEERGTKGAALTTYLSLAGRYMVLMPGTPTRGVSRKAEDDQTRKQIKKAISSLDLPENIGCIARTAALDQTREELERDYLYLMRLYENIQTLEKKVRAPALIYKESNLVIRSIRDYFTTDMDEVLIDDPEVFREAREFFSVVMPDHTNLVKLHQERRPIFSRYQIEEQIEMISRSKVPLPSGGSIVIDSTEALVAIDVNSGKLAGESNVEATATRTNLEAAEEVARQLRLRDLGGLIVIDFIDMRERKHIRQVEEKLREGTARDKARISIGHISQFGLLEMSRQRIKPALAEGIYRICPHCSGAGRIRSVETLAVSVLRRLHAALAKGNIAYAEVQLARDIARYLNNEKRLELVEMERGSQVDIQITGRTSFLPEQVEITLQKREKEKQAAEFVEARAAAMAEMPARPAEPAAEAVAQPADEAGRNKRNRGRKKKSGEEELAVGEEGISPELSAEPLEAREAADEGLGEQGEETVAEESGAKKKRRRRNRKKKATGSAEAGAAPEAQPAEAGAAEEFQADEESAEEAGEETVPGEETAQKKKRRRRGRKKKSSGEAAVAPAEAAGEAPALASESVVPLAPAVEEPAARPKRPRSRKASPESAESVPAAAPSREDVVVEVPPASEEPVAAKPARKRSVRAKKEPAPVEPSPAGNASGAEVPPAAPKRRSRKAAAEPVAD